MWQGVEDWAESVTEDVKKSTGSIVPKVQTLLNQNRELLEQDGKMREKFISDLTWKEKKRIEEFTDLLSDMKRWIVMAVIGMLCCSGLLSVLICHLIR